MSGDPLVAADFVPPILRTTAIAPQNCALSARFNERTNVTHFTYQLTWTEINEPNENSAPATNNDISVAEFNDLQAATSATVQSRKNGRERELSSRGEPLLVADSGSPGGRDKSPSDRTARTFTFSAEDTARGSSSVPSDLSVHARLKDGVLCNGPCGRQHKSEELTLLGRCGHYLCKSCASIVLNADGSVGCSSKYCYRSLFDSLPPKVVDKLYNEYVIKKQVSRKREIHCCESPHKPNGNKADKSAALAISHEKKGKPGRFSAETRVDMPSRDRLETSSNTTRRRKYEKRVAPTEAILFRLLVVNYGPDNNTLKKTHMEAELSASLTLREAVARVVGAAATEKSSAHVYRVHRRRNGDAKFESYSLGEYGDKRLCQIATRKPKLRFVLDLTGRATELFGIAASR